MASVRFGVIGLGVNGARHLEELATIPGAEVVAVADTDGARATETGRRLGVPAHSEVAALLGQSDVDVVDICTPSGLHAAVALQAAAAGKHAVVEKPMDVTLEAADAMIGAFRRAGRHLAVISQHRFDPATVRLRAMLAAGELGEILLAQATANWFRSQSYYDSGAWRGTWALDGGGATMNQSIHTVDVLQHLVGPVASVWAVTDRLGHERIEVEDVALAVWRLRSGGLVQVACTTVAYPGFPARIALFGRRGSAVLEDNTLTGLYLRPGDESGLRTRDRGALNLAGELAQDAALRPEGGSSHRLQLQDMVAAIQQGRDPLVTGEEGRKPLELILAMYRSARLGRAVDLPLTTEDA